MSRSYDEAEQALRDGASFWLIEPISSKKLKPLWQFAFRRRSNQEAGGAFGSAVTNNSSGSLASHPGNKNLPNFPPCANQDLDTNFAASSSTRHQSQLPEGGVAATAELLGFAQARVTAGIATNPDNFPSNFGDGIQNPKPMVEGPAAGLPNIPPYANQNQDLTTNFAATFNSNCKNQLPATTTEPLGFEQTNIITSGIATNSENVPTNFTYGMQNLQSIVELAPAAGSSRHPAYANQNQDLNTIREAPFSTRYQSQLPEGGVAGTTELVGSVQGETTSGTVIEAENFLMSGSGGIQNEELRVEQAFAAGSSNQNQPQSELAYKLKTNVDCEFIYPHSLNQGDNEQNQEPMVEHTPAADFLDDEELNLLCNQQEPPDFGLLNDMFGESTDNDCIS